MTTRSLQGTGRSRSELPPAGEELVFVVDVTSFTANGFVGTSSFSGGQVSIEFDPGDEGVFLTRDMAARLSAEKGSRVLIVVEDGATLRESGTVAQVGAKARVSNSKVYFAVGREGGAVVRVRSV